MTSDEFAGRIVGMTQTLYRVSCAQLSQGCDREDAVQECLRKAWEKRGRLKDDRFFQTWLIRILLNECHNMQSRGKRSVLVDQLPEQAAQPADGEGESLRAALFQLTEALRMPILLHYIEGYPVEEVARVLRIPAGTVKSRMARGRRQLRDMLSEEVFEA
ncbi:RNA polymerase sigma factor [Eubacteriales bacterium OttesenSCG-928-A19]|nr:RNA polymerase sigma factor [Eubacteriales bacterium OttesenSCG-928-A19]